MSRILLKQGRMLDPGSGRDEVGDLYVADGLITAPFDQQEADRVIALESHHWVCPGLIDSMTQLCEPGMSARETIETGTEAAAAGGFTAVITMPGNKPVTDEVHRLLWIKQRAAETARVRVYPTATISRGLEGQRLTPIGSLFNEGAVALTDHYRSIQDNELMRRALEYASMFDIPILDHCLDERLSMGGVMHEGIWSAMLGLKGSPAIAEEIAVARNALLAEFTGARIHCQQVSSAGSLRILNEARQRGIGVSAGVSPNHLFLDDSCLADYESVYKFNPPLRTLADRDALRQAVIEGVIGFFCSDHSPHCSYEKEVEFDDAPVGAPGLETALGVTLTTMVHESGQSPLDFLVLWTTRPARFFGLPDKSLEVGAPADITVIDPDLEWVVDPRTFKSKSKMSPFSGRTLKGRALYTMVGGEVVWESPGPSGEHA